MRTLARVVGVFSIVSFGSSFGARPAAASPTGTTYAQAPTANAASVKDRERRAHVAFSAGRYEEAISLLAELYSDVRNPVYLRNIGRCYQKLKNPDRAIASFEEYLAKGKNISPEERAEIQAYIKDMESVKRSDATAAAAPPPAAAPAPAAPAPAPSPAEPPRPAPWPSSTPAPAAPPAAPPAYQQPPPSYAPQAWAPPPASPQAVTTAPAEPPPPAKSSGNRIGSYVLMGLGAAALVAGGVVLAGARSKFDDAKDDGCGTATAAALPDECNAAADSVKSRNTISAILFGAGAVAAGVGVVLFITSKPDATNERASRPDGLTIALSGRF